MCVSVETQVQWLRETGFQDVDCHWKWLDLALFGGSKESHIESDVPA